MSLLIILGIAGLAIYACFAINFWLGILIVCFLVLAIMSIFVDTR